MTLFEVISFLIDKLNASSELILWIVSLYAAWKIYKFVYDTKRTNTGFPNLVEICKKLVLGHNKIIERLDGMNEFAFGEKNSPLQLKAEWKTPLEDSDLKEQLDKKINNFVKEVQSENPKTEIDAQKIIRAKVDDVWIQQFDLTDFKRKLYGAGGSESAINVIVYLYLQEIIIQKLEL